MLVVTELLITPPAEAVTVRLLGDALADKARVATQVPNPRPDYLVRVTRTGGSRRGLIFDEPQMTVECWAPDSIEAEMLCGRVSAILHAAEQSWITYSQGRAWVYSCTDIGGVASHPDPDTDAPRYQMTVQLRLRLDIEE